MRIVNGNRSPDAIVWFQFPFHISILEDGKFDALRAGLEQYARDNPRSWHSFSYCRVDEVHIELEKLVITIGFQHRSAWQELPKILMSKADLMCTTYKIGKSLGVNYDEMPKRELLYYAGVLKSGGVKDYRTNLHDSANIQSHSKDIELDVSNNNKASMDDLFLAQLQQSQG